MKIGVKLWLDESPGLQRTFTYAELRDVALRVEALGYDSIWLMDHLLIRGADHTARGVWESWTLASALAEATTRVELGHLVSCTQFRNPALVAKMATALDDVSGGRFILGLGAGWNRSEFDAFGIPVDHRVSRFEEAIQIICPLLREGHVDYEGVFYQARDCERVPRGPRAKGPPILFGCAKPRMLRLAARWADMWNITGIQQPESLAEPLEAMRSACEEVGRDPLTLGRTVQIQVAYPQLGSLPSWMGTYVSGSDEEVAAVFLRLETMGFAHLMIQVGPYTQAALVQLAAAIALYRQISGSAQDP